MFARRRTQVSKDATIFFLTRVILRRVKSTASHLKKNSAGYSFQVIFEIVKTQKSGYFKIFFTTATRRVGISRYFYHGYRKSRYFKIFLPWLQEESVFQDIFTTATGRVGISRYFYHGYRKSRYFKIFLPRLPDGDTLDISWTNRARNVLFL